MKLLIVEDNPAVRKILRKMVAPITDNIRECDNAETALALYRAENPDFVLMDINLGKTNGIFATRQIRAFDPTAKIIIVTSYDEKELRSAASDAGAIGFVVKEDLTVLNSLLHSI